jgi:hypothetical protein
MAERIDLLFSDLVLPGGMSERALAVKANQRAETIPAGARSEDTRADRRRRTDVSGRSGSSCISD